MMRALEEVFVYAILFSHKIISETSYHERISQIILETHF